MSFKMNGMSIVLLIVLSMQWDGTTAQSGCTNALISMSPCLNYVNGNSLSPSSSCCSRLANVVQTQPRCLCSLLNGGSSNLGFTVNQTLALALPGACNVQTPPVSQCNAVNGPAAPAPALSPAGSPSASQADEMPANPETPSDAGVSTGSKTVPRTDGASSGGSNPSMKINVIGVLVLISSSSWAISGTRF